MTNHPKRSYNSEGRQAKAQQTRKRILDAAESLFELEGIEPVTLEKLAKVAAVSEPTIYLLFKSKKGILQALLERGFSAEQFNALIEQRRVEKSPKMRLLLTAKLARCVFESERNLINIFRGAAVLFPELKEVEQERETRRYTLQVEIVTMMAEEKSLAAGLNFTKARDILWALTSRDLHRLCVIERGWTSDEYESWLAELLIKALLK